MKFWKMNGAGNDFIVIDNRDGTVDAAQWPRIARTLCERNSRCHPCFDGSRYGKRSGCFANGSYLLYYMYFSA